MLKEKDFYLRNVKVFDEMSEETVCFSATLYIGGKKVAYVSNHGVGGSNEFRTVQGVKYSDIEHLDNLDTECEIMDMVIKIDYTKKNQRKGFVLTDGDKLYKVELTKSIAQLKKLNGYDIWLRSELKKFEKKGYEVLNTNL